MSDLKTDLQNLAELKARATEANKQAKATTSEFKAAQRQALDRMRAEDIESLKSGGVLFSPVTKEYATVEDRSEFVRWALAESEPIAAFLESAGADLNELINALSETSFIQIKEHTEPLNALVRERLDDGQVLPPGIGFRVDEYISQRTS